MNQSWRWNAFRMAATTCAPSGWPACVAQLRDRAVRDLVDDAAGQRVHGLLPARGVSGPNLRRTFSISPARICSSCSCRLTMVRRDLGHLQPRHHALHLFGDQRLGVVRFLHALAQVGVDHFLQIVDVVEEDVVEVVDRGLDIARHGDIDEEHRLVAAGGDDALHLVLVQDVVRRAGARRSGYPPRAACSTKRVYSTGVPWKSFGHFDGALMGAVGDEDVRRAGAAQVARGQLATSCPRRRSSPCGSLSEPKILRASSTAA